MGSIYDDVTLEYGTNTNIRLIELLPGPVWCDGQQFEIGCKFWVLPLIQGTRYTAISYMWGRDDATVEIVLDETRFAVRPNLSQLLLTLSRSELCTGLLWVDAICINQESTIERNHQVGMMGEIYSRAMGVIVWLSSDNSDIPKAIERLQITSRKKEIGFYQYRSPFPLQRRQQTCDLAAGPEPQREEQYELASLSTPPRSWNQAKGKFYQEPPRPIQITKYEEYGQSRKDLLTLCTHPYWSRAWIVQELFLAKAVCIQCIDCRLDDIDDLFSQIRDLRSGPKISTIIGHTLKEPFCSDLLLNSPAAKLLAKREIWQSSGGRTFVKPWDGEFGHLECADVRDRVYAMTALMDPKLAVMPDYKKSPSELFGLIFEDHLKRVGTFSGPIWNLQSILALDDQEPVVQRAKQYGSFEWVPTSLLGRYTRDLIASNVNHNFSHASASSPCKSLDEDPIVRMRRAWSERERRRRTCEERLRKSPDPRRDVAM